jgi:hypothetical protein
MEGTATLLRGQRRTAATDGHPRWYTVAQEPLTKSVLAGVRIAVEMPLSSTLADAVDTTELLQGCKVARKIALLALSTFAHRGVRRR